MTGLTRRGGHHFSAVAASAAFVLLSIGTPQPLAQSEDDVLQKAINYIFAGKIDPQPGAKIVDRKACIVIVPDLRNNRSVRYYLGRFNMDRARFEKIYVGRNPTYRLAVEGDDNVVEFLNPDNTVAHGHRSVRIPLRGEIDASRRALKLIADRCKREKPKAPF